VREKRRCNRLDGKTWTRYSISVWDDIRKTQAEARLGHPASFPLQLAERCIEIFTEGPGEVVLDPFAGSGTTLIGACNLGRRGLGLELYPQYQDLFKERVQQEALEMEGGNGPEPKLILGDARRLSELFDGESADFVFTSPPYWDILMARRSADRRGRRFYGDSPDDLGRSGEYSAFLRELQDVFRQVYDLLKPGRYCVVVVMDLRKKSTFYPLHMDLSTLLQDIGFLLDDTIIWDRRHEYNSLRPLGYPSVFRVNKVHEYLLIFKKPAAV
jgi:DNA modification methylase